MTIVLDASAALAWLFERSDPSEARQAEAVLSALVDAPALVPCLWHIEVANALPRGGASGRGCGPGTPS